jgi:hypothetical protein
MEQPDPKETILMVFATAAVLLVGILAPANAYIDAGSGSYMLQMSLAGILAVAYSIKLSWGRVKSAASNLLSGSSRERTRSNA